MTTQHPNRRPIIGCTTYRKTAAQATPVQLMALMPTYPDAVAAAGGVPVLIPLGLDEDALSVLLSQLDGLLLTGGGDIAPEQYHSDRPDLISDVDRDRDRVEVFLAREAVARGVPLLAICRGHQVLNVALGGTLYEDVRQLMPGALKHDYWGDYPRNRLSHGVTVREDSRLGAILGKTTALVNSLHHQGVRDLAPGLEAVAHAPDGLVEGVEVPDHPFAIGVQWHPENLVHDDPDMLSLFRALVEAAAVPEAV
jgi:putative glutamine amidotransferase